MPQVWNSIHLSYYVVAAAALVLQVDVYLTVWWISISSIAVCLLSVTVSSPLKLPPHPRHKHTQNEHLYTVLGCCNARNAVHSATVWSGKYGDQVHDNPGQ